MSLIDYEVLEAPPEFIRLKPTPLQKAFIDCPAKEVLYGGARGGGKSYAVVLDWLLHSESYKRHARGIVLRRSLTELDEFIEEAKDILGAAGHLWSESKKQFKSPEGAILRCRYLDNDRDAQKYQGHRYTRVYVEEIGNFPDAAPIKLLLATLRSSAGVNCQLKATANPGGPGHTWVKARYIDVARPFQPYSENGGRTFRVFIPAKVTDNPHITDRDAYIEVLKQTGSKELVRAWLEGDWDAIVGQYFDDFRRDRHIIPTIELGPEFSVRYRAMDWGSARPFCVLWFAVSPGGTITDAESGRVIAIPAGALVVYRELYGWNGTPNQGLRLTTPQVAELIKLKETDADQQTHALHRIDPATFATNGGPSIAEQFAREGVWWKPADNKRTSGRGAVGGWDQVRNRLKGEEGPDGPPMIFFMDCCEHIIRTLPVLPHDPVIPDDVDTSSEDHAADTLRYGCMARPWNPTPRITIQSRIKTVNQITMDEAWDCQLLGGVNQRFSSQPGLH